MTKDEALDEALLQIVNSVAPEVTEPIRKMAAAARASRREACARQAFDALVIRIADDVFNGR